MPYIKYLILERIMNSLLKQICEPSSRIQNRQNQSKDNIVHIAAKRKTATTPIFTGFVAVLSPYNCQRWDLNTNAKAEQPIAGIIRMIVTLP